MKRWGRVARRWVAVVSVFTGGALTGCATQEVSGQHLPQSWEPRQGVVAFKVVTPLRRTVEGVSVKNLDTGEVSTLEPTLKLGGQGVRLMRTLPAGTYELVAMDARAVLDMGGMKMVKSLHVPLDGVSRRFLVGASQLTDLGTMAIVPLSAQAKDLLAVQSWAVLREDQPVGGRDWLAQVRPALAQALGGAKDLGWLSPVADDGGRRQALLSALRAQGEVASDPATDARGRYVAGADLGVVMRWDGSTAQPERRAVNVLQPLGAVAPLADGRVLVAGDEGYSSVMDPASGAIKVLPEPGNRVSVVMWAGQAADGQIYLVNRTLDGAEVLQADPVTLQWRVIRRMGRGFDDKGAPVARSQDWVNFASLGQSRPWAVGTRTHLVIYTAEPHALHVLHFPSRSWAVLPGAVNAVALARGGDDVLVARDAMPNSHVSFDHGQHWQKIDSFMNQVTPVFADPKLGYLMARSAMENLNTPPKLYKTTDGGLTWQADGAVPLPFNWDARLLWDSGRRRLGYLADDGRLLWRSADGQAWR